MDTIERINQNIKEAVAAINSCMPTAMEAAENIRKNLKLLSEVNSMAEPQLIQGYTAEQWQEIIDGGYLCEFRDTYEEGWHLDTLRVFESDSIEPFESSNFSDWVNCRPAQIKGAMRPIFVEPVDKSSMLCLFDRGGFPLNNRMSRPSWYGYKDGSGDFYAGATKYIEL